MEYIKCMVVSVSLRTDSISVIGRIYKCEIDKVSKNPVVLSLNWKYASELMMCFNLKNTYFLPLSTGKA